MRLAIIVGLLTIATTINPEYRGVFSHQIFMVLALVMAFLADLVELIHAIR